MANPQPVRDSKARAWCFTWNNYPFDWATQISRKFPKRKYWVGGCEVAPTTGTPHIQGYVEFNSPAKFSTLQRLGFISHWEIRKRTAKQASDYCKKEDPDFVEEGTISQQGARHDLAAVRDAIVEQGASFREVAAEFPSVNAHRTAQTLLTYFEPKRRFKPTITWIYGPTGVGKSHRAEELAYGITDDLDQIHTQTGRSKWWDGYDAHTVVIIEELRKEFCDFADFLVLIDRYPHKIEVKGGFRQMRSRHMFITSSKPPELMWHTDEDINQLLRRIDNIYEIKSRAQDNTLTVDIIKEDAPLPAPKPLPLTQEPPPQEDELEEGSVESDQTVRA